MSAERNQLDYVGKTDADALNRRLETIGWALFLIMIGGIGLVPKEQVPPGAWLIGVGLILLGLNVARYASCLKTSGFSVVLGVVALAAGLGDFLGMDLPIFPILLIVIGANLLVGPLFDRDRA